MMIFICDKPRYGPELILIANFIVINIFILLQIISTKTLTPQELTNVSID